MGYTKYTMSEFVDIYEEGREMPEVMMSRYVYVPNSPENPYLGLEYEDGECWVFGNKVDSKVSKEDLIWYMEQEG